VPLPAWAIEGSWRSAPVVSLKLADIIDLIVKKSGKSKDEVVRLIEAKKKELDGYVTDEGAASLVARELDIDLFEEQPAPELKLSVRDLVAGMTGVSLNLKVLRIFPVRTFTRKQGGEGKVASIIGADATGSVRVIFWDRRTKPIEDRDIEEGDIIKIINGRVKTGLREQLEIHLGLSSRVMPNPPDADPEEFKAISPPLTKIASLEEGMLDVNVRGTVVGKFQKSTFSRSEGEGTVASLTIEDETGRTRLVLWDEQASWFDQLDIGDRIQIESGYVRLDRNNTPELHVGRRGRITPLEAAAEEEHPATTVRQLKDLRPGDYGVTVDVAVVENQGLFTFPRRDGSEGRRLVLVLADETGRVRAVAWGTAADSLADLKSGDFLHLENARCRVGLRRELELHINEATKVERNPPGLKIESLSSQPIIAGKVASPRCCLADATRSGPVTVRGTIVQLVHQRAVYDACPSCSRKVTITGEAVVCPRCGTVSHSVPRLIAKVVIDDGTENMRARFIGEPAEKLLGITGEEAKKLVQETGREDEPITRAEDRLLGREVILYGRVRLNTFSNELEISVDDIQDPNPVDEARLLLKEVERKVSS